MTFEHLYAFKTGEIIRKDQKVPKKACCGIKQVPRPFYDMPSLMPYTLKPKEPLE